MIFSYNANAETEIEDIKDKERDFYDKEMNVCLYEPAQEQIIGLSSGLYISHFYNSNTASSNSSSKSSVIKEDPFSKGEECIQKDVLRAIDNSSSRQRIITHSLINDNNSSSLEDNSIKYYNTSSLSNSRMNLHSKNFILKSDLKKINEENNNNNNNNNIHCNSNNGINNCNAKEIDSNDNQSNFNPYNLLLLPSIYSEITETTKCNGGNSNSNKVNDKDKPKDKGKDKENNKEKDKDKTITNSDDLSRSNDQTSTCNTQIKDNFIIKDILLSNDTHNNINSHHHTNTYTNTNINANEPNDYESLPIEEIIRITPRLAKEQQGCRFLQRLIDTSPKIVSELYQVIKDSIVDLSCAVFGNYLVQKIVQSLSLVELDDMIRGDLSTFFRQIALNPYGTRVIQKFLSKITISDSLLNTFNILLKPHLIDFAINKNANHIIILYMSLTESPRNDFIITELKNKVLDVSKQKYSCYTLQKCIEYCNENQRKVLLYSIAYHSAHLFMDLYGHYVVQYAIMAKDRDVNRLIINSYLNDFPKYSCSKYSSTIYEKCIEYFEEDIKMTIVERLCDPVIIKSLLFDLFGNYVLQKTIQIAAEPYKSSYVNMIRPLLSQLNSLSFGPKTVANLIRSYPELLLYGQSQGQGQGLGNRNKNMGCYYRGSGALGGVRVNNNNNKEKYKYIKSK